MRHIGLWFVLMYLLSLANSVMAEEVDSAVSHSLISLHLNGNASYCGLIEHGSAIKDNPYVKKGKSSSASCEVRIPEKEFFNQFEFCALSSMKVYSENDECQFTVGGNRGEVLFYSISGNSKVLPGCSFICHLKSLVK